MNARPEVTAPTRWAFPEPETTTLSNGLTVQLYDVPGQYVLAARLVVPLALRDEPRDREGVATLMARLLDEGTTRHTTEEFTELLERKGIAFGAGLSDGGLSVDADVAQRRLGEALGLMRDAVATPSFPEKEFRRLVRTRLAEIEQERASATHRGAREFAATYFDPTERASRPSAGTASTLKHLTRADVVDFHARFVAPNAATLVIAGDLTGVDVHRLVEETLGTWPANPGTATPPRQPSARATDAARIVLVDRPDSVQSDITVGWDGPDRHVSPEWAPFPVLGFVIGGSPNARVDAVLREDKGYTYGMRSSFRPRSRGGLFLTNGSVRTEVTGESLRLLLDILDGARDGLSPQECRDGVDFIRNTAPGRFATADAIADEAAALALDGLPPTFTTANLDAMSDLTDADLTAAYARFVEGTWTIVVVGNAEAYAAQLRDLGRGEVTIVPN